MRKHVTLLVALATSVASAGPAKKPVAKEEQKPVDLSAVTDKLVGYKDDVGNMYVIATLDDVTDASKYVFFGDAKTLHAQRIIAYYISKDRRQITVWSPRAKDMSNGAYVELTATAPYAACRPAKTAGGHHDLTPLTADELSTLVAKAKFYPLPLLRAPHFLARDEDANYYYVDSLASEQGGKGYRVYIGQTGAMKQVALTNMASDSVGELYATKSGKLKVNADGTATWVKGGKSIDLTIVPVDKNRYLVYRELGIYGSLGTVCDDQ